ncbi:hypothetical protein QMI71_003933 [Salmonella enterica]|nr:hypothetical protein [Salmonella enterica]
MLKTHIKQAIAIQQKEGNASNNALEQYVAGIASYNEDKDGEYDYLYANYQALWIYSNFGESEKALSHAKKCMELMADTISAGAIFHYTDIGQFYKEVIRYATNTIAWYSYKHSDSIDELEQALETISHGCSYIDSPDYFYAFDTKVRILLKLGRKEDAFKIVFSCLQQCPDFSDFSDIKKKKEYQDWKNNFDTGTIQFSDQETVFLQKAARITSHLKELATLDKVNIPQVEESIPEKQIVLIKDIKEKYSFPDGYYEDEDCLLLYKGSVHIKENLDEEWCERQLEGIAWKNDLYGILIDGNLVVEGDITIDQPVLSVTQNLTCDYLYSGDGHTLIQGNANIKYGIYGEFNDGSLEINGLLTTAYILAHDHSMPRKSDAGEFIHIEGGDFSDPEHLHIGESYGSGWGWGWNYFDDATRLLNKAVFMEDDGDIVFSVYNFFAIVKRGENPFHEIK